MMKKILFFASLLIIFLLPLSFTKAQKEPVLKIYGEIKNPINITYSEFQQLPMVNVNSSVICVGVPADDLGINSYLVYTYDWKGVRLIDLLEMVEPTENAYDMVFMDNSRYSSSISIAEANRDDFILAIYADGQELDRSQGYPFRLVLPCYWGYKWVKYVERIEITDYDHRGFWESRGYPDDGQIPGCTPEKIITDPKIFNSRSLELIALGSILILFSLMYNEWG